MFPSATPSFQPLSQTGMPPTLGPVQPGTQRPQDSLFSQQPSLLPPPSHYPGVKIGLISIQQGIIVPPSSVKAFKRGPSVPEAQVISPPPSHQTGSPAPVTLFEKYGICHSLSYMSYLKSIAAEPPLSPEDEPPQPPSSSSSSASTTATATANLSKKNSVPHKKHRRLRKARLSLRSKVITPSGEVNLNYSSSCPSSPSESSDENMGEADDAEDKTLSSNPEEFFFSGEFLENENVYEDKPYYDLLRDCRILTDEEVVRRRREKNSRLNELYKNELLRLRDIVRVRHRRFFLKQVIKDNEAAAATATTTSRRGNPESSQSLRPKMSVSVSVPPDQRAQLFSAASSSSTQGGFASKKCSSEGCQKRCIPPTDYCFKRTKPSYTKQVTSYCVYLDILSDPNQKLFKGCTFKSSNGIVCNYPILISQKPSLCPIHADLAGSTSLLETRNVVDIINTKSKPLPIPTATAKDNKEIFMRIAGLVSMIQSKRHRLWRNHLQLIFTLPANKHILIH